MNTAVAPMPAPGDRLVFTVFLALLFHALLILGVDFAFNPDSKLAHTLEITLAMHQSPDAPKTADFLAEFNQIGSGSETEKAEISTDRAADFHSDVINQVNLNTPVAPKPQKVETQKAVISSSTSNKTTAKVKARQEELDVQQAEQMMLLDKSREIASLEAQLREQRQAYAKRPRIRQVTSVTTLAHHEARYLQDFRQRVEAIGNRNFPKQALRDGRFGSTRLLVAIKADGQLHDVRILKSSGIGFIDDAALASVRLAAPFPPFPPDIRKNTDILEIIRTWKFDEKQTMTTSQ